MTLCFSRISAPLGLTFPVAMLRHSGTLFSKFLRSPDSTRLFTGHDYMPDGREPKWESSVAEQRDNNPHLVGKSAADYIALRERRDSELPMPKLMLHALQVNTQGGRLPEPEANGKRYLKIPLNALKGAKWD